MAIIQFHHDSKSLGYPMEALVVLPEQLHKEEKLKCLWLYHGGGQDHWEWLLHTGLAELTDKRHFAAVLPYTHESCFVDMHIGGKYGTYVGEELPKLIWKQFRCISEKREDNYVSGLSNGGYGCLHTALTYPQLYAKVGAFSAGDKADAVFLDDDSPKSKTRIRLYGAGDIHETEYCLIWLADRLLKQKDIALPEIYHACGEKDPWLDMNHIVRDYFLTHTQYTYVYDEMPGMGHEWDFWKAELLKFLDYAGIT